MRDGTTGTGKKIWRMTGGEERVLSEEEENRQKVERIKEGLARCSICGAEAKLVLFGLGKKGVWIGCDRTGECGRYIEMHSIGWSIEDVARDWNRRNRGLLKLIRTVKRWFHNRTDAVKRNERRMRKENEREKEQLERKRREVFGINEPERAKRWWKFGKKGNK